jgi:hypothetical protein
MSRFNKKEGAQFFMKKHGRTIAAAIGLLAAFLLAMPAAQNAEAQDAGGDVPQLEILYYQWIHNDIIRNIEEIRRAKYANEKRELVEDIEAIIYDKIEFPLMYKQAELSDEFDLGRIGVTSDSVEGKEANPAAPEIAQAYALLGVAKGYEGFGAAAADMFGKAKEWYSNVMNMTVSLDHNEDERTLGAWVSASRGTWGNSTATRCTFFGKRISQSVVDLINNDTLSIYRQGQNPDYTTFVAKRDFVRGLKRYIATDDSLAERRVNNFTIYLPPGRYVLKTAVSSLFEVSFDVSRNVAANNYIIETLHEGISIYPIPDIQVFEEELKRQQVESQGDTTSLDDGMGDLDDLGDLDSMSLDDLEPPPAPESPLE